MYTLEETVSGDTYDFPQQDSERILAYDLNSNVKRVTRSMGAEQPYEAAGNFVCKKNKWSIWNINLFLAMSTYFFLRSKFGSRTATIAPVDSKTSFISIEDSLRLTEGNYEKISFPVVFKQTMGRVWSDLIDCGLPAIQVLHTRVIQVIEDASLTGWKTYEIEVYTKKGEPVEGYVGLSAIGRCDKLDITRSTPTNPNEVPAFGFREYKGYYFDESTWDGSDFFLAEKYWGIFLSKRAHDALAAANISNLKMTPLEEVVFYHDEKT